MDFLTERGTRRHCSANKVPSPTSAVRTEPTNARSALICERLISNVPSFADLYTTYFNFVWSMSRFLGVDAGELDDVVQDIFVIIYERLHTLEQPESLRSWIYGIVRRVVSKYHRTKRTAVIKSGTVRLEPELLSPEIRTPEQMTGQTEEAKLVWNMLQKLDAPKREIFVLAEVGEMTAPEIAAAIDIPLNTVYSRLRAARQELEEALQRLHARTLKRGQV